jgi:hypothetical protein
MKNRGAKHQWLMLVILATQEAEIRRITVQSQLQKVRPYLKKTHHKMGQGEGHEFNLQYCKKKEEEEEEEEEETKKRV